MQIVKSNLRITQLPAITKKTLKDPIYSVRMESKKKKKKRSRRDENLFADSVRGAKQRILVFFFYLPLRAKVRTILVSIRTKKESIIVKKKKSRSQMSKVICKAELEYDFFCLFANKTRCIVKGNRYCMKLQN